MISEKNLTFVNTKPPESEMSVVLWGDQYQWKKPRNPFMRLGTGLTANTFCTWPWWFKSTGVQSVGDEIGISIHSPSIRKNFVKRNLGTIVLSYNYPKKFKPFADNKKMKYSFDLRVPTATTRGGAVAQVVAFLNFTDMKNKIGFWYGFCMFDSRGTDYKTKVQMDNNGTNQPIVTCFAGSQSPMLDTNFSSGFSDKPYSEYRHYEYIIDHPQLNAALIELERYNPQSKYSSDTNDYSLGNVNLNPEIWSPRKLFSYSHIGLTVRNWKIEQI